MELDFRTNPQILADIVDNMAIGVFTVDAEGRFVAWSDGAERITGYPAAEAVGRPCNILEGPNCKGFATIAELLKQTPTQLPCICSQECKLLARDGRELFIHGSVRLITNSQGQPVGAVGTFVDMTASVIANQKYSLPQGQTAVDDASYHHLIGKSPAMQEVFRRLKLAADSDVTVLITGESGTGKELAAAAIHAHSARRNKPLLAINCAAIPESLLESELFGHLKGAFTSATADKLGMFEAAHGGTLLLDEIGEVSPALQVKLLRVLQEREIRRVGDHRTRKVDVRLIAATNQNLPSLVAAGKIREDFFYRVHVFEITMPPLRQRRDDIPILVDRFIKTIGNGRVDGIARDAMQQLQDYYWPGNVRQLRNAIEHACVTVSGDRITYLDLPVEIRHPEAAYDRAATTSLSRAEMDERERIVEALRQTGGNRTQAARLLGTSRVTLWKKINRYAIPVADG
jgi:PAS domain S-box-containing protein